jgi:hypothetical protein
MAEISYSEPTYIDDINVNSLTIVEPEKQKDEAVGKMFYVNHKNVKLRVMLPEMEAPFGAGPGRTSLTANSYSIGLTFKGMDADTKRGRRLARAHEKLKAIDKKIEDLIVENKEKFFKDCRGKKKVDENTIRNDRWKPFVFVNEDENKPKADRIFPALQLNNVQMAEKEKLTGEDKERYLKTFKTIKKDYPLVVDVDGTQHFVNTENVTEILPSNVVVKPILELSYLWDKAQEKVSPRWSMIYALRTSNGGAKPIEIHRDSDDEDSDVEMEEDGDDGEASGDAEDMIVEASA